MITPTTTTPTTITIKDGHVTIKATVFGLRLNIQAPLPTITIDHDDQ